MTSVFDNQNTSTYSDSSFEGMQTSVERVLTEYQQNIGMESFESGTESPDGSYTPIPDHQAFFFGSSDTSTEKGEMSIASVSPTSEFTHLEIGGGRILGTETSKELGGSVNFAMYSTEKYMPPTNGDYKTVTTVDGSKWYHQYAQPTVVKEPYMKSDGKIQYREQIENKLPEPPKRKDKI